VHESATNTKPLHCPGAGRVPKNIGHQICVGDLDLEIIALASSHTLLTGDQFTSL